MAGRRDWLIVRNYACVTYDRTTTCRRLFPATRNVDGHLHRRVRLALPRLYQTPTAQQRLPVGISTTRYFLFYRHSLQQKTLLLPSVSV